MSGALVPCSRVLGSQFPSPGSLTVGLSILGPGLPILGCHFRLYLKEDSKLHGLLTKRSHGSLKFRLLQIKKSFLRRSFHIHYNKMYILVN